MVRSRRRRRRRATGGARYGAVQSLAGYARTESGRELLFALISNGHKRGDVEAIAAADDFAAALVRDAVATSRP